MDIKKVFHDMSDNISSILKLGRHFVSFLYFKKPGGDSCKLLICDPQQYFLTS